MKDDKEKGKYIRIENRPATTAAKIYPDRFFQTRTDEEFAMGRRRYEPRNRALLVLGAGGVQLV
jgi:hypothetical protein